MKHKFSQTAAFSAAAACTVPGESAPLMVFAAGQKAGFAGCHEEVQYDGSFDKDWNDIQTGRPIWNKEMCVKVTDENDNRPGRYDVWLIKKRGSACFLPPVCQGFSFCLSFAPAVCFLSKGLCRSRVQIHRSETGESLFLRFVLFSYICDLFAFFRFYFRCSENPSANFKIHLFC